jgi:hypothetical protein
MFSYVFHNGCAFETLLGKEGLEMKGYKGFDKDLKCRDNLT